MAAAICPTILVNSATGSDTAASGAGPGTALTGSSASTNGAGTVVTLDGSPDLTGVAIDGSHVIFLNDTTAGNRNFSKITNTNNGTKTVTVADAFGGSLSGKGWAIGGKRSAIGTTLSTKLFSNNSAAGDCMPGWTVEMESGHTETIAANYLLRRAGNLTDGPITLRGTSDAATRPIITFSNNGVGLTLNANCQTACAFELKNSHATKTASVAISVAGSVHSALIDNIKCDTSGSKFWKFLTNGGTAGSIRVVDCAIAYTASNAITCSTANYVIRNNYIHDITGIGITITAAARSIWVIQGNIIYNCSGDGINVDSSTVTGNALIIDANTIDLCGGDGIEIAEVMVFAEQTSWQITNNILSNPTGKNINLSGAGSVQAAIDSLGWLVLNNNCWNGGTANVPSGVSKNDPALNPNYVSAATGDFTVGSNMSSVGFSLNYIGRRSITRSYNDIGAAQIKYRLLPVAQAVTKTNIGTY